MANIYIALFSCSCGGRVPLPMKDMWFDRFRGSLNSNHISTYLGLCVHYFAYKSSRPSCIVFTKEMDSNIPSLLVKCQIFTILMDKVSQQIHKFLFLLDCFLDFMLSRNKKLSNYEFQREEGTSNSIIEITANFQNQDKIWTDKTPMHTPSITNLDDVFQCESFQEALRAQLNVMKEENGKLRAENFEMREQFHSWFEELIKQQQNQMEENEKNSRSTKL
ncbi:hypothetical protein M9H77_13044 [Catharanthus roseus]|uniref:Uncharacterized protein n=1 Tax=Catharanthus roseus TaxID=4058 RepID=A0ACC0BJ12_CATRO|nr:hypothetical protein M9H77_13044 [Catharanthus roseus]